MCRSLTKQSDWEKVGEIRRYKEKYRELSTGADDLEG